MTHAICQMKSAWSHAMGPAPSWLLLQDCPRASGSHNSALVMLEYEHKGARCLGLVFFFFPFKEVASLEFYVKISNF